MTAQRNGFMDLDTIHSVHTKIREEGARFSEGYLRRLVANGTIPSLAVGNRRYISYTETRAILEGMKKGGAK